MDRRLLARKKSSSNLSRKRSNSATSTTPSDQKPREEKSAPYRDTRYPLLVKTKAAIKRAGGFDPTWAKVEQCHQETAGLPQNEPCRFCGKTFPSWKKLTVHLAKHMEHISCLPSSWSPRRNSTRTTIISPVQEPPPRTFPTTFLTQPEQQHPFDPSNGW
ncbi:hypothetical protein N658DRAFT_488944 [Parathielavia hyrcaniae]|uniref:C2H2-type domain-containing protein n=1 Tax=Parathielavia hyrcaniae TaxID=113614 RepID=A0AAN6PU24_9PEZI|nr:hypothetical protein N658DRAFT_488944 [Parathielavia hyrcaniae]